MAALEAENKELPSGATVTLYVLSRLAEVEANEETMD